MAYHALASGDPRAIEQLDAAARHCGREALGGELLDLDLTSRGFLRRAGVEQKALREKTAVADRENRMIKVATGILLTTTMRYSAGPTKTASDHFAVMEHLAAIAGCPASFIIVS